MEESTYPDEGREESQRLFTLEEEGLELKAADGGRVESLDSRMNVGSILSVVF